MPDNIGAQLQKPGGEHQVISHEALHQKNNAAVCLLMILSKVAANASTVLLFAQPILDDKPYRRQFCMQLGRLSSFPPAL